MDQTRKPSKAVVPLQPQSNSQSPKNLRKSFAAPLNPPSAAPPSVQSNPAPSNNSIVPQIFQYFLVTSFEATCEDHRRPQPNPREIIEFFAMKINAETLETEAIFHQYVSPTVNKTLTNFCTKLTMITQGMVDGQPNFDSTLKKFAQWMKQQGLLDNNVKFAFVTYDDWLMKDVLGQQCMASRCQLPEYMAKWINIGKTFYAAFNCNPFLELDPISTMLGKFRQNIDGPRHSAMYVCHNILKIMKSLATEKEIVFQLNNTTPIV